MTGKLEELIEKLAPHEEVRPRVVLKNGRTQIVLVPTPPISNPLREKALLFKGALVTVLRVEEIGFSFEDMWTIVINP